MSVSQNIRQIKASLPKEVTLVAVSKFHPIEAIDEAYKAGQRVFGESRAQELVMKEKLLRYADIEWHFIGTLQTNKVKEIAPFIHTIQSIDSLKLLREVEKQAKKNNRKIRVLLEIHVAEEDTKHGFNPDECRLMLDENLGEFENVVFSGVMGMATFTDDESKIRKEFKELHSLFTEFKEKYFADNSEFKTISMGMSHDYHIAVEEGSTMVRIGTDIFGEREY